jgi:hypothetical protein
MVRIFRAGRVDNFGYAEFGFDDRRNGKPSRAWMMLLILAKCGGTLKAAQVRIPRHENYHSERMKIIVPMRSRLTIPG